VDDGSPDETALVAKSWMAKDKRFLYFRKKNGGLSSARNLGIYHASGRFIQFLDSDDVLLPEKLQHQVRQLVDRPSLSLSFCDYSRGGVEDIYAPLSSRAPYRPPVIDGITSLYELAGDWETRLSIPPHCFLFDRLFFDEGIKFDESLQNHEDWDCWMQVFARAEWIGYCPEKLVIYRYHPESMCRDIVKMREGFLKAIDKHLDSDVFGRDVKAILRSKRAEINMSYEIQMTNRPASYAFASMCYRVARKLFAKNERSWFL